MHSLAIEMGVVCDVHPFGAILNISVSMSLLRYLFVSSGQLKDARYLEFRLFD
jgi:hypothetical protein